MKSFVSVQLSASDKQGTQTTPLLELSSEIDQYLSFILQVLPSVLEQVVSCRDGIAQEYLMECIIQVKYLYILQVVNRHITINGISPEIEESFDLNLY